MNFKEILDTVYKTRGGKKDSILNFKNIALC